MVTPIFPATHLNTNRRHSAAEKTRENGRVQNQNKTKTKFLTLTEKMDNEEKLSGSLAAIFNEFTEFAEADQDIRDQIKLKVRDLEQCNREAVAILAKIHHCDGLANQAELLTKVDTLLDSKVKERIQALSGVIPKGHYFRFHQHFNYSLQKLVFITTLIHYLRNDQLLFWAPTAQRLGMTVSRKPGFFGILVFYLNFFIEFGFFFCGSGFFGI